MLFYINNKVFYEMLFLHVFYKEVFSWINIIKIINKTRLQKSVTKKHTVETNKNVLKKVLGISVNIWSVNWVENSIRYTKIFL